LYGSRSNVFAWRDINTNKLRRPDSNLPALIISGLDRTGPRLQ